MLKLFISQPMRGKTDEEILKERNHLINRAKKICGEDEIEVIDSFFQDYVPKDAKPLWYLGESLKLMADADVVIFAKDWENARGCKIEYQAAIEYGFDVILSYSKVED